MPTGGGGGGVRRCWQLGHVYISVGKIAIFYINFFFLNCLKTFLKISSKFTEYTGKLFIYYKFTFPLKFFLNLPTIILQFLQVQKVNMERAKRGVEGNLRPLGY